MADQERKFGSTHAASEARDPGGHVIERILVKTTCGKIYTRIELWNTSCADFAGQ